ncbi:MAG: hypothetical protein EWM47_11620 [Anaerolineaceae bacterium]|nr:MAG: hypothetical protein EWM47_11620 [Anaerolineaceae bacterium]
MKKLIVTLCSLALSLAGTFGVNQLASNDEAIIDRNKEQVTIEQDADAVEDTTNLPADEEIADKASNIEEAAPKAEDVEVTDKEDTVKEDTNKENEVKGAKQEKNTIVVNNDKKDNKKSSNKKVLKTNTQKENVDTNKKKTNNTNNAANNNTQDKASDYINNSKSNGNNAYVFKNIDLSNCNSTQDVVNELQKNGYKNININNIQNISSLEDILSLIGDRGAQNNNNKPAPTKPAPTTTPTKPAPTTTPTKPAPTTTPSKPTPTAPPTNNSGSNQGFADEVLRLVNIERSKAGLSALTTNATLKAAADKRAQETKVSFSHTRPNGSKFSTVLQEYGISYRTAGENIAYGQRSPQEVVNGWMNSPRHRANILNGSFGKIGIGVYQSGGVIYWSQLFTN